jgi:porphyrinogen peroxidase
LASSSNACLLGYENPRPKRRAGLKRDKKGAIHECLQNPAEWGVLATDQQERIIGRAKLADIELDDASKPSSAHNALTTIVEDGREIKILRDNMPFGRLGGECGTYFIGYSRSPRTIELMLENLCIGKPHGNYDRLLDFSRAVTANLFFVPSGTFLEDAALDEPTAAVLPRSSDVERPPSNSLVHDGSPRIGSLKGNRHHE